MGPPGPREEIQAAIAHTGCALRPDPARGGLLAVDCPTFEARAELVDALAWRDAMHDGEVRRLALELTRDLRKLDAESVARRIHQVVRARMRYVGEAGDVVQDPITSWHYAAGDCDCHARLVLALLRALGVRAVLCGFTVDGPAGEGGPEVRHACATWERAPGDYVWLETTLAAEFGEHPMAAAARLFADRADLR